MKPPPSALATWHLLAPSPLKLPKVTVTLSPPGWKLLEDKTPRSWPSLEEDTDENPRINVGKQKLKQVFAERCP